MNCDEASCVRLLLACAWLPPVLYYRTVHTLIYMCAKSLRKSRDLLTRCAVGVENCAIPYDGKRTIDK